MVETSEKGREMPPKYYDGLYLKELGLGKTEPAAPWVHKYIIKNYLRKGWRVIDIGCGASGYLAQLCISKGLSYIGLDFSKVAIENSRKIVPKAMFHLVDLRKDQSLLRQGDYDVATFIQFLEHINKDLEVLRSIPSGKMVVLSVPQASAECHVRCFQNFKSACSRYGKIIDIISGVGVSPRSSRYIIFGVSK